MIKWDKYRQIINESTQNVRYSVEVNYDTSKKESLIGFAKICLGYVSACMKKYDYHTKIILSHKPYRVIVSSRNWDDGEWVGMVSYNSELDSFVVSKGFYNKLNNSIKIKESIQIPDTYSAKDIGKYMYKLMDGLKNVKDRSLPDNRKVHIREL